MHRVLRQIPAAFTLLVLAVSLSAFGGFSLVLGSPEASADAKAARAVLTIRATGCADPSMAIVSGTAIGMVKGKKQSIPLTLLALPQPGFYALARQWPQEGRWVLQITGKAGSELTTVLVPVTATGVDRYNAKHIAGRPDAAEVAALLN